MSYLQIAEELRKEVNKLMVSIVDRDEVDDPSPTLQKAFYATQIGHIVNLAVRSCPRGVQHTVRKNIVATAVKDYCNVSMTEVVDENTGRSYHKINISPKG